MANNKMVVMSGASSSVFLNTDRRPAVYARTVAKDLGLSYDENESNIAAYLRGVPSKTLMTRMLLFKNFDAVFNIPWKPVVDSYAERPMVPKPVAMALADGDFDRGVAILGGVVSEEGLILSAPFHKSERRWNVLMGDWATWAPHLFFFRETDLITREDIEAAEKVYDRFFGRGGSSSQSSDGRGSQGSSSKFEAAESAPASASYSERNLKVLEDLFTVSYFHAPFYRDFDLLAELGVTLYGYHFDYRTIFSLTDLSRQHPGKAFLSVLAQHLGVKLFRRDDLGVCHSGERVFLFPINLPGLPRILRSAADVELSRITVRFFANFVKSGNPTPATPEGVVPFPDPPGNDHKGAPGAEATALRVDGRADDQGQHPQQQGGSFTWDRYTKQKKRVLSIKRDGSLQMDLDQVARKKVKFWNDLVRQFNLDGREKSGKPFTVLYQNIAPERNGSILTRVSSLPG